MVINKEEIALGIVIYKDVILGYESLVKDIEEVVGTNLVTWNKASVTSDNGSTINENTRDTSIIGIPYTNHDNIDFTNTSTTFFTTLSSIFYKYFNNLERDYFDSYNFSTSWHDGYSILKYSTGQKFTNHIDDHKDYIRRVSTIYYMNDDYVGGEINFPRFNISYKPKANELLIFPSNYIYNHSVSSVTKGTRYSVVSWMS
jgi:hypothetical protein